jgi:hypothetical protein
MARENQGLQIALIVFVMLAIILGVTTYLCFRKWDDADKAKEVANAAAGKKEADARNATEAAEALKTMIGVAKTEDILTIKDTFKKDMDRYGVAYPEQDRLYRSLLEKMYNTINQKSTDLTDAKAEIPKREDEYKKGLDAKEAQVTEFRNSRDAANADLDSERTKFQTDVARIAGEKTRLQESLQTARKEAKERLDKINEDLKVAEEKRKSLEGRNEDQAVMIERFKGGLMVGEANGEITWVDQRNGTVWINLGRDDGLMRQVTFSVYPFDITDMTAPGANKGKIEVTEILGPHLAQARITQDEIPRPILIKDKIYTPLWCPGERRHFALAGLMDLDGDGRSDLEMLKSIIAANGGVVDCYIDDAGKPHGELTPNTNSLILGKRPTDKEADARMVEAFTKVLKEADQLRLAKVQLADLLQRMGWRNTSPVIRYGRGANPNDFRPTPEGGVTKKSIGRVTDIFEKRQPPKAPASAY